MTKIIEPKKQSNIFRRPSSETGIWSWITTVDHKRIGIMYGYAAFFFLLVGGLEALVLRIQLSQPDNNFLTAAEYNAMFTMHGTTMIFLAIMPISAAFFNYLLPLQIGARDVAFPRLNALSFWIFIFGGAFLYSTFIFGTAGAPEGGYLAEEVGWLGSAPNGGWFGILKKSNSAKLARVTIEYSNDADSLWSLDITKTNAKIPYEFVREIKLFVDKTSRGSNEKLNRGRRNVRKRS